MNPLQMTSVPAPEPVAEFWLRPSVPSSFSFACLFLLPIDRMHLFCEILGLSTTNQPFLPPLNLLRVKIVLWLADISWHLMVTSPPLGSTTPPDRPSHSMKLHTLKKFASGTRWSIWPIRTVLKKVTYKHVRELPTRMSWDTAARTTCCDAGNKLFFCWCSFLQPLKSQKWKIYKKCLLLIMFLWITVYKNNNAFLFYCSTLSTAVKCSVLMINPHDTGCWSSRTWSSWTGHIGEDKQEK